MKGFRLKQGLLRNLDWKLLGILVLPIVFVVCVKLMVSNLHHSICLYKFITGHECWGCGLTRAFNQLFQFHFKEAFEYNPRIVIVAPLLFLAWLQTIHNYIQRKQNHTLCDLADR